MKIVFGFIVHSPLFHTRFYKMFAQYGIIKTVDGNLLYKFYVDAVDVGNDSVFQFIRI